VTVLDPSRAAYTHPLPGLDAAALDAFRRGDRLFATRFTPAGVGPAAFDGLGPEYVREACTACHDRDGRGAVPAGADDRLGVLSIRIPDGPGRVRVWPEWSVTAGRAALLVDWEERAGRYVDGTPYRLRRPRLKSARGPLPRPHSARAAPAVIGLGLLEAVPEAAILALADPEDRDQDGISGRPAWVVPPSGGRGLGRFGWKASSPDLGTHVARAAWFEMGLSNPIYPDAALELSAAQLGELVAYLSAKAVPAARAPFDPSGAALFRGLGCAACHRPELPIDPRRVPAAGSVRAIAAYTDLLLHDLGPELDDGLAEAAAESREWRTAPLWGLSVRRTVNGHLELLHDGRARDVAEAILWHGGEAMAAREGFRALSAAERAALIDYVESR
jgi:CxxC motif-containing protein (DUF1111 family)